MFTLTLVQRKTYILLFCMVVASLVLPQLCHLIPQGGQMLQPLFFFTLVAAYAFGWQVGLATALLTPVLNSLLFGMPMPAMLPFVCFKSVLLAGAASVVAHYTQRVTVGYLALVVVAYQVVAAAAYSLFFVGTFGVPQLLLALPGMVLQVLVGYVVLRVWSRQ